MNHHRPKIPWHILASNLGWSASEADTKGDLCLLSKPSQGDDLGHFAQAFVGNLKRDPTENTYHPSGLMISMKPTKKTTI